MHTLGRGWGVVGGKGGVGGRAQGKRKGGTELKGRRKASTGASDEG